MAQPSIHDSLLAFCHAALQGVALPSEIEQELRSVVDSPWAADADNAVREYMCVPNHVLACQDLDCHRFSSHPLMLNANQGLHIFHILNLFSKTNPQSYATVWLPLLDAAEASNVGTVYTQARNHLRGQLQEKPEAQLSQMMQSLVGAVPGLQTIVQQILGSASAAGAEGGMPQMITQIQGMLQPLLNQAAATATAEDPTLQPAITQILSGFSALNDAIQRNQDSEPKAMCE